MKCGLLGRTLGHSYSPAIHAYFGDYPYCLWEKEPEDLADFLRNSDFSGINVTMPYKKAVIPYLDELTPQAQRLGTVNTIVRRHGKLIGHNTDYFGFRYLMTKSVLSPAGKKCLVLGSGGASNTAVAVLEELGAEVVVISRSGKHNYENLHRHRDTAILVNTTPVGMYPNTGISPVDLSQFPDLEGVVDVVYNPCRTQLILDAELWGIPAISGLPMLVAQAKEAAEWFTGKTLDDSEIDRVYGILQEQMENIVLIGMPGCGKSTIGRLLAQKTGKIFVDADAEIEKLAKKSIPQIFAEDGEGAFRTLETQVLAELGKGSNLVIATGGGCVTREENYPLLHQNSTIFWLQRDVVKLPTEGRPLSQSNDLQVMYAARAPLYARFADYRINNNDTLEKAVAEIGDCYASARTGSQGHKMR